MDGLLLETGEELLLEADGTPLLLEVQTTPPVLPPPVLPPTIPEAGYTGIQNFDGKYAIEVHAKNGGLIAEFSGKAQDRTFKVSRNGSYSAEWKLDVDVLERFAREINTNAASLFAEGQNEVVLKRLGTPLFGGQIDYGQGDLAENREHSLRVIGWLDLFQTRQTSIEKIFPAGTKIGDIAAQAIQESQALNFGNIGAKIGQIADTPALLADALYEFKSIKELLQLLSERVQGIDFEFTWDKTFNVSYPKMGVTRTELEFVYPGNVLNAKPSRDASTVINYAVVRGQGFGDALLYTISQDEASMAAYGRRETVVDFADVPDVETLQALGDEYIRAYKDPLEVLELTLDGNKKPFVGSYWLGDYVKVTIEDSALYGYVTGFYRIDEITVQIDDSDNEVVNLKLSKR